MPRENAAAKARRYLTEGRVILEAVEPSRVRAVVRGDGELHRAGWDRRGWWCDCDARGRCSHLQALGLVVAVDLAEPHTRQEPHRAP